MKSLLFAVLVFTSGIFLSFTSIDSPDTTNMTEAEQPPVVGRWDITFDIEGAIKPGWLEVKPSGSNALVGRVLVIVGSARPVSQILYEDGKMHFSVPRQNADWDSDLTFDGTYNDDKLTGKVTFENGSTYSWTAVRAPRLRREEPQWGSPVEIFNGYSLTGWHGSNPDVENQWVVENGVLKSPHGGVNLITDEKFNDFKLHVEFKYSKGGNSGVYLRGRYEVQIEDGKGKDPENHLFSAIYGLLPPSEMVAMDPGEWQSFDITLVGRMVNVVANGTTVICNQEIPGITGGALDCHEAEPGPIMLQGDHQPIEYRNIVLTPGVR